MTIEHIQRHSYGAARTPAAATRPAPPPPRAVSLTGRITLLDPATGQPSDRHLNWSEIRQWIMDTVSNEWDRGRCLKFARKAFGEADAAALGKLILDTPQTQ